LSGWWRNCLGKVGAVAACEVSRFALDVKDIPQVGPLQWGRIKRRIGDKVARFRQLNADKPNVHHDALEFPDGEIVLVTRLCEGQHATVLQLPASPHSVNREVERKDAAVVG